MALFDKRNRTRMKRRPWNVERFAKEVIVAAVLTIGLTVWQARQGIGHILLFLLVKLFFRRHLCKLDKLHQHQRGADGHRQVDRPVRAGAEQLLHADPRQHQQRHQAAILGLLLPEVCEDVLELLLGDGLALCLLGGWNHQFAARWDPSA